MAGGRRLRDVEAGVDVAHADFAVLEQGQNPEAGWIRQRTVNRGQRVEVLDLPAPAWPCSRGLTYSLRRI